MKFSTCEVIISEYVELDFGDGSPYFFEGENETHGRVDTDDSVA
ncbi:MAG: hypothetical protein PT934_03740 [Peptoniphilaceae bacterium]|nr:hypothetical protein [Parvimonas sp.]MDD7764861.1 hypothetical protein [Peptoniphilaceae bacterium]MDY3050132.1 hypothetical protein [Parvimonas sp.]